MIDQEFNVVLANPAKIQTYSGLKHSDDKSDAFWLAEMLRLGRRERKWNLGTRR